MIIGGFTSYTWAPDWALFRSIADEVGALLLADISHAAGMATAGAYPNPIGIADVITCTTHKTLCGPRGAIIMTSDEDLAHRIDMAVFPGEQGGPHTQKFAAMAVAFKIAASEPFRRMMWQIKENAAALADGLTKRGLKLAYGGTDTHFCMLDLNSVRPVGRTPPPGGEVTRPYAANRPSVSWTWPASWPTRTRSPATCRRRWRWASAWAPLGSPNAASAWRRSTRSRG